MPSPVHTSPWLHQLDRSRPMQTLDRHLTVDVAVVGAGIAGIMTAYYLLTRTDRSVLLLDARRVAHGATGHNAGQLVSYFERPFYELVETYGLEMASTGQRDIEAAWDLIRAIVKEEKIETDCHIFEGYAACLDWAELERHLKNNICRKRAKMKVEKILVAKDWAKDQILLPAYRGFYTLVTRAELLKTLQSKDDRYVAAVSSTKGCMNSAAFCEELLSKLLARYPDRLQLAEQAPMRLLRLERNKARLFVNRYHIDATQVVLCTNGFEHFTIRQATGVAINHKFHHLVRGSVGYMAAFFETSKQKPIAISYLPERKEGAEGAFDTEPYYYLTRRPYEAKDHKGKNLICIGGPESLLDNTNNYHRSHPYPKEAKNMIQNFVRKTYPYPRKGLSYAFLWHGLMGYTPNGLRCVGFEPCNPVLLYNLGCNGVGILPSFFGGLRVAQLLNGEILPPSIFDPQDTRCELPPPRGLRSWLRRWLTRQ